MSPKPTCFTARCRVVSIFAALLSCLCIFQVVLLNARSPRTSDRLGDGCHHVYIDLGTNVGVQIRKLYEPSLFPGAPILPIFDAYFGTGNRSDACAFGFEPNPRHKTALDVVEARYAQPDRSVSVERAAVGCADGIGRFIPDTRPDARDNAEWGAAVAALPPGVRAPGAVAVRIVDIAAWLERHVLQRQVPGPLLHRAAAQERGEGGPPPHPRPPALVMKLDVEGADEGVLRCLLARGALCAFSHVHFERAHVSEAVALEIQAALHAAGCQTKVVELDDESYRTVGWDPDGP